MLRVISKVATQTTAFHSIRCRTGLTKITLWPFNSVDQREIKKLGPDLACAQWLHNAGGAVQWLGTDLWHTKDTPLPEVNDEIKAALKVEKILANKAMIMREGLVHLQGLTELRSIRIRYCKAIDDDAVDYIRELLRDQLLDLEVTGCYLVTDASLMRLDQMKKLQTLRLSLLEGVADLDEVQRHLQKSLPQCQVSISSDYVT